jgi:Ca2+-binding EF-hand superfamily protein
MSSNYRLNGQNLKNSFELLDYRQEGEVDVPAVLDNLRKLGYDKSHPELYDLINSLGEGKINYSDYVTTLSDIMNQKEEDAGLQRMYDLLIYNPKIQFIDAETLKRIADETGHPLSDLEVQFALNEVGDGKVIPIESFIKFMKSN